MSSIYGKMNLIQMYKNSNKVNLVFGEVKYFILEVNLNEILDDDSKKMPIIFKNINNYK
jgi:hypothetical protein